MPGWREMEKIDQAVRRGEELARRLRVWRAQMGWEEVYTSITRRLEEMKAAGANVLEVLGTAPPENIAAAAEKMGQQGVRDFLAAKGWASEVEYLANRGSIKAWKERKPIAPPGRMNDRDYSDIVKAIESIKARQGKGHLAMLSDKQMGGRSHLKKLEKDLAALNPKDRKDQGRARSLITRIWFASGNLKDRWWGQIFASLGEVKVPSLEELRRAGYSADDAIRIRGIEWNGINAARKEIGIAGLPPLERPPAPPTALPPKATSRPPERPVGPEIAPPQKPPTTIGGKSIGEIMSE